MHPLRVWGAVGRIRYTVIDVDDILQPLLLHLLPSTLSHFCYQLVSFVAARCVRSCVSAGAISSLRTSNHRKGTSVTTALLFVATGV
jgi:hypothetical protein